MKLVEQKYRRLLNLLVEESLCQQQGGKHAWNKLGHKQRVKAISALSAQATEIWENGRFVFLIFFLTSSSVQYRLKNIE